MLTPSKSKFLTHLKSLSKIGYLRLIIIFKKDDIDMIECLKIVRNVECYFQQKYQLVSEQLL